MREVIRLLDHTDGEMEIVAEGDRVTLRFSTGAASVKAVLSENDVRRLASGILEAFRERDSGGDPEQLRKGKGVICWQTSTQRETRDETVSPNGPCSLARLPGR
jgi:hypothetical protein